MTGFPAMRPLALYNRHRQLYITASALLRCGERAPIETVTWTYPHNPQEQGSSAKGLSHRSIGGFSMISRSNEAATAQIVASCDGDIHGALKALLLVNEQLAPELQQHYAAA